MQEKQSVYAEKGRGFVGDRYYYGEGTFNKPQLSQDVREVSIISSEALQECNTRLDTSLTFADLRRNLIIEDLDIEQLKKNPFHIGSATFEIVRTCPPCRYLSRLLDADMMSGLKYIGGYRARIVQSGEISVNDHISF